MRKLEEMAQQDPSISSMVPKENYKSLRYRVWDEESMRDRRDPGFNSRFMVRIEMLSTGIKDKNGKEIYEGDIVLSGLCVRREFFVNFGEFHIPPNRGVGFYLTENCLSSDDWVIQEIFNKEYVSYFEVEVIGNIYENPELLK